MYLLPLFLITKTTQHTVKLHVAMVDNAKMALNLNFISHGNRPSHPLRLSFLLKCESRFSVQCALQVNQFKGLRLRYKFYLPYVRDKDVVYLS